MVQVKLPSFELPPSAIMCHWLLQVRAGDVQAFFQPLPPEHELQLPEASPPPGSCGQARL